MLFLLFVQDKIKIKFDHYDHFIFNNNNKNNNNVFKTLYIYILVYIYTRICAHTYIFLDCSF